MTAFVSYKISINEAQRKIIYDALREKFTGPADFSQDTGETLRAMFSSLPEAEFETPGVLHGFAL